MWSEQRQQQITIEGDNMFVVSVDIGTGVGEE